MTTETKKVTIILPHHVSRFNNSQVTDAYVAMIKIIENETRKMINNGQRGRWISFEWSKVSRNPDICKEATIGLDEYFNWLGITHCPWNPSGGGSKFFHGISNPNNEYTFCPFFPYMIVYIDPDDPLKTYTAEYRRIRAEGNI